MAENECKLDEPISTFVFLDFESTGLLNQRPRITELCLLAVHRQELLSSGPFLRTVNKLTLCLNPQKPVRLVASQITGLYNDSLELQEPFNAETVQLISVFLKRLEAPICLVAHNGNGFDFPLLVSELNRINGSLDHLLLCADSLETFRVMDGLEPRMTPSTSNSAINTPSSNGSPATNVSNTSAANLNSSSNHKGSIVTVTNQVRVRVATNQNPSNQTSRQMVSSDNPDYQTPDKPITSYLPPLKRKHMDGIDHSQKSLKTNFDTTSVSAFRSSSGEKVRKRLSFQTPEKPSNESATETTEQSNDNQEELLPLESMFSDSLEDCDLIMAADLVEADILPFQTDTIKPSTAGVIALTGAMNTTTGGNNCLQEDRVSDKCTTAESDKSSTEVGKYEAPTSTMSGDDNATQSYHLYLSETQEQASISTPAGSQAGNVSELCRQNNQEAQSESITTAAIDETDTDAVSVSSNPAGIENTETPSVIETGNTRSCASTFNSATPNLNVACDVSAWSGYSVVGVGTDAPATGAILKQGSSNPELANQLLISRQNNTTPEKQIIPTYNYRNPAAKTPESNSGTPSSNQTPSNTRTPTSSIHTTASSAPAPSTSAGNIQQMTTPKKKSYKLGEIYLRLYGHLPFNAHRAEDDCVTMMKCVQRTKGFLEWVDQNAVLFSTIQPAY